MLNFKWKTFVVVVCVSAFATFGVIANGDNDVKPPEVTLPQGVVRGQVEKTRGGRDYFVFYQVPYASAERFELPQPAAKWDGVRTEVGWGAPCAQIFWVSNETAGVEDCLQVYVHTPKLTGKLPVIVFIHGGGFTFGTPTWFVGNYMMDEDVVLVVPSYRLGALGFLSTGDDVIPGNLGLKDQSYALKWVQENIDKFGGDPNQVTLAGLSAGGASVTGHMLSPMSRGLFKSAIAMSGTSLNPWALSWNPRPMAEKYAIAAGCPDESLTSSQNILSCLKEKPLEAILDGMKELQEWGYDPFTPFGAVVEPEGESSFWTEVPEKALREGRFSKVPVMTGIAQDEGIMMHAGYVTQEPRLMKDLNEDWERVAPITLEFDRLYTNLSDADQKIVARKIKEFYFGERLITQEETYQQLVDMYSDRFFNNGVKKATLLLAKHVPTYLYKFTQSRDDYSAVQLLGYPPVDGVGHADDLSFLFHGIPGAPLLKEGSIEEEVSKKFVKLYVSFARESKPTATWAKQMEWNPISEEEIKGTKPLQFYRIAAETSLESDHFVERYKFWERLFDEFPHSHVRDEL